jgi:hypothetical protein
LGGNYCWADKYYKVREEGMGFVEKPRNSDWIDWSPKNKKVKIKGKKKTNKKKVKFRQQAALTQ